MTVRIYVHPTTREHFDYGDLLSRERGTMLSMTGKQRDAFGFEFSGSYERQAERWAEYIRSGEVVLEKGEPIYRSFEMNPQGAI